MAAVHQWVHFKETPRPDGLCPLCFNPSLKLYHFERIDMDGVTILGTRVACTDCNVWVSPTKAYTQ